MLRDGSPIVGVTVELRRSRPIALARSRKRSHPGRHSKSFPPIASCESNSEGRFLLRAPRRSRLVVAAFTPGSGPASAELTIPRAGNPADVELKLTDGFALGGIVVNEDGRPVPHATVIAERAVWRTYSNMDEVLTDQAGRFTLADLTRGSYQIHVNKGGYPSTTRMTQVPEATEIRIRIRPGGAVLGKVVDNDGSPIVGGRVVVSVRDAATSLRGWGEAVTGTDGNYVMSPAPIGDIEYAVFSHGDWGSRSSQAGQLRFPAGSVEAGMELRWDIELATGATVRGVVVDKATGAAVPDARVDFFRSMDGNTQGQGVRHGMTGSDGRFEIGHVPEGSYFVGVKAKSHVRALAPWRRLGQRRSADFAVEGSRDPEALRIEVEASGRVEGRIMGEAPGDDWTNASVVLDRNGDRLSITSADSTGFFVFEHAPATEGLIAGLFSLDGQSKPFAVVAGRVTEVTLEPDRTPHFIGTVIGAGGQPISGAYVKACPEKQIQLLMRDILIGRRWRTARTDSEGRFRLKVDAGWAEDGAAQPWAVAAVSFDYPLQIETDLRFPKAGDATSVRIVLKEGGVITGSVERKGAGPIPNVEVTVSPKFASTKAAKSDPHQARKTYTDLAGGFKFRGVGEGDWIVTISDTEGIAEPVEASAGARDVRLLIEPTLSIAGTVVEKDGSPVARATVRVKTIVNGREVNRGAETDHAGRFRLVHLPAGEFSLAVQPADGASGFRAMTTEPYTAGSKGVRIEVDPGYRIRGVIVGPNGKPVPGAGVGVIALRPKRRGDSQPTATANNRGEFTIQGVEDGTHEIVVVAEGYLIASAETTVGRAPMRFQLEEGGTVKGLILQPNGRPCGGLLITIEEADPDVRKRIDHWRSRAKNAWFGIGALLKMVARTKSDGTFEVSGLFAGRYTIQKESPRGILDEVVLHTGAARATLRMRRVLKITGTIAMESGQRSDAEILIEARSPSGWEEWAYPDAKGNFELSGMPDEEVTIRVQWTADYREQETKHLAHAGDTNVRITLKMPQSMEPEPAGKD